MGNSSLQKDWARLSRRRRSKASVVARRTRGSENALLHTVEAENPWERLSFRCNPKRDPKIIRHISRGVGDVAEISVRVEFPLSESYILVSPVRVIHAGYIRYYDRGWSESMAKHGLTYIQSGAGTKKADLFVLVFDFAGERYVRRMFREKKNVGPWRDQLLQGAANKVALSISKDERNLMRKLVHGYVWPSSKSS